MSIQDIIRTEHEVQSLDDMSLIASFIKKDDPIELIAVEGTKPTISREISNYLLFNTKLDISPHIV